MMTDIISHNSIVFLKQNLFSGCPNSSTTHCADVREKPLPSPNAKFCYKVSALSQPNLSLKSPSNKSASNNKRGTNYTTRQTLAERLFTQPVCVFPVPRKLRHLLLNHHDKMAASHLGHYLRIKVN